MSSIEERIAAVELRMTKLEASAPVVADIDGMYGDPEIRKDPSPKHWSGASCAGQKMSRCPADYLLAFAKWKDACVYMKMKELETLTDPTTIAETTKYAGYDRKDAARARAWAAKAKTMKADATSDSDDGAIPF